MERFYDEKAIYDFLDFIKSNFPESFIRTNFIIGFPGETEEDVKQLHAFIQQDYFDNIALFEYHDEPLAASSKLPDQIPSHIIRQRFLPLRRLVNNLLLKKQETRKGKTYTGYVQDIHVVDNPLPSVFNPSTPTESGFPSPDREEKGMERNATITVRPILHCPEIDEVDEISIDQIISCEDEELQIASKITYHL